MGTVELRLGDMFDGPSDLIVLPCSRGESITRFVREMFYRYLIPRCESQNMALGDIEVQPFVGGEYIAQFVAYAASVQANRSRAEAIRHIGLLLGDQTTRTESIRRVSAPLLGAGAGRLESEVAVTSLSEGFLESSHKDATLVISVLDETEFQRLQESIPRSSSTEESSDGTHHLPLRPPGVFISYSHSSPDHKRWVIALGEFLRQNGVDARLDIWHLRRGMDLAQFMTNELTLADRVILVSDERYAEKADGRVGGVGWETMIVQGDIARLPPESTKYLILVKCDNVDIGVLKYLQTKFVIHWPNKAADLENREILLREIFDMVRIPPLGRPSK